MNVWHGTPGFNPKKFTGKYWMVLSVNGKLNKSTKMAFQNFLQVYGYYSGVVDASFGKMTRTAIQKYLRGQGFYSKKYLLDGVFGQYTWMALNDWANHPSSPGMYDKWHPNLVKTLQRRLNGQRVEYFG